MSQQTIITEDEVRHIAKLAKLKLTDEEIVKFQKELSNILTFVGKLEEVDTSGVEETSQVTGLTNVFGEDEVKVYGPAEESRLLDCSTLPKTDNSIQIPKMM